MEFTEVTEKFDITIHIRAMKASESNLTTSSGSVPNPTFKVEIQLKSLTIFITNTVLLVKLPVYIGYILSLP